MKPILIIVGAGPGMGHSIARRFGSEGFRVALVARRNAALEALAAELQGVDTMTLVADVTDEKALNEVFHTVQVQWGAPDVVVYNAAMAAPGLPSTLTAATLETSFRVNVVGALITARLALDTLRPGGKILYTGGGMALSPIPQMAALGIGKAGLRSLATSLHHECKDKGIHVATVTICGFVKPDTHFDPDKIAEEYWTLYQQPQESWELERQYR